MYRLQRLRYLEDHLVMHGAATQRVWMTDEPGKFGGFSLLFGFEYPLQVTLWSWYVDVKYLAYGVRVLSSLKIKGISLATARVATTFILAHER